MPVEIEIICSNGDRATALCEAGAVTAARTMRDDYRRALPVQGRCRDLTFSFLVAGQHVRTVDAKCI